MERRRIAYAALLAVVLLAALVCCEQKPAAPAPAPKEPPPNKLFITTVRTGSAREGFIIATNTGDAPLNLGAYSYIAVLNGNTGHNREFKLRGTLGPGASLALCDCALADSEACPKEISDLHIGNNGGGSFKLVVGQNGTSHMPAIDGDDLILLKRSGKTVDKAGGAEGLPYLPKDAICHRLYEAEPSPETPWTCASAKAIDLARIPLIGSYTEEEASQPVDQFAVGWHALVPGVENTIKSASALPISWISRSRETVTLEGNAAQPGEVPAEGIVVLESGGTSYKFIFNLVREPGEEDKIAIGESAKAADNIALGDPGWTMEPLSEQEEYFLSCDCHVISYNNTTHNPNWVSWHLCNDDFRSGKRKDAFREDDRLPSSFNPKVDDKSYSNSGFDRGHMCPSGDRTSDSKLNKDTFYMTNMVPQSPDNNQGPWEKAESNIRKRVRDEDLEAYIVSGPFGVGGENKDGVFKEAIGTSGLSITVPSHVWKVVLFLREGTGDLERITEDTETLGIWMPNTDGIRKNSPSQYYCSVDFIEEKTGYDFFNAIPDGIEDVIEAREPKAAGF